MNEVRPAKSADELSEIVLARLRQHPVCSVVQGVTVLPQERPASHHQNWKASFTVAGAGLTPAKAFEVAQDAMEFDLAP
jgi:hypothetical protein